MVNEPLVPRRFDVDHHGRPCYRPRSWCIYCDEENVRLARAGEGESGASCPENKR